jgi:hypothetical protein
MVATSTPNTALARIEPSESRLLRPIAEPSAFIEVHKESVAIINEVLEEGRDYGKIPGTERPALLKPGAERLTLAFGLRAVVEVMTAEVDHERDVTFSLKKWSDAAKPNDAEVDRKKAAGLGRFKKNTGKGPKWLWQEATEEAGQSRGLYRYVLKCKLEKPDGTVVGEGVGSCSSLEAKYIRSPRDAENTILKMAKKRAHVDAVLTTLGLSDRFTQDEDLIKQGAGETEVKAEIIDMPPDPQAGDAGEQLGSPPPAKTPPSSEQKKPPSARAVLIDKITAEFDALGLTDDARSAEVDRILGEHKPKKTDEDLRKVLATLTQARAQRELANADAPQAAG